MIRARTANTQERRELRQRRIRMREPRLGGRTQRRRQLGQPPGRRQSPDIRDLPAGGIRASKDAVRYLVAVAETVGEEWLTPHLWRFGASSLVNDVLLQRQKMRTGHYSGHDYVTVD